MTRPAVSLTIAFLAACAGGPSAPASSAPQVPGTSATAGASSALAPAAPSPASDPNTIVLEGFAVKIELPPGWSARRGSTSATALSPSGKSGFVFFATKDVSETPTFLHQADEAFHTKVPFGMGKMWTAPGGLRFSRTEKAAATSDGKKATAIVLLGTSPAVPGSSVGVVGFALDGDADAKSELGAALDTISAR